MCNLFPYSNIQISWPHNKEYSLDELKPQDWESIRSWRNAQLSILRQNSPLSFEEQQSYWKKLSGLSLLESRTLCFSYKQKGQTIGYGGLVHIDFEKSSGEVSTLLDPIFAEPSPLFLKLSSIFLELTQNFAQDLGLQVLTAEIFDHRIEMIRLFHKLGFEVKDYLPKRKQYNNHHFGSWLMEQRLRPSA